MPWIQYDLSNGLQLGSNSSKVSDDELLKLGKAQIFYDGSPSGMMVDINQNPPVVVPAPSPPTPPADILMHIFSAMVQQGWIDPTKIDQNLKDRANASLAVTGANTIP